MSELRSLVTSVATVCIVFLSNSMLITINYGGEFSVIEHKRYAFFSDAMNVIENDNSMSAIAIGSSMMFNAVNGNCMQNNSNQDIKFYNLGIQASTPYADLPNIDKIKNSNVEVVMIELAPRSLGLVSKHAKADDYIQLRFEASTMFQNGQQEPEWIEIILPEHRKWINVNDFQRTNELQKYTLEGIEYQLQEQLLDDEYQEYLAIIPNIDHVDYVDYLKFPEISLTKHSKIESMSMGELEEFNESIISKDVPTYYPHPSNTRNHMALEYMIDSLIESNKKVVIITMPHYGTIYDALDENQWEGFNQTLDNLSSKNLFIINLTFDRTWTERHFADQIHLDWDGREYFCERVSPVIDEILSER